MAGVFALLAHEASLRAADPEPPSLQLQEVVVTARFRQESTQKVGESIQAFDNQQIEDLGIHSLESLAALTPGLDIQDRGPNRNEISIDGVGRSVFQQDRTLSMANVGLYLDDVPIDIPVGAQLDVSSFDLKRIEVLRGPQGVLFGAGAEAGAVRYITQSPNLSRLEGTAEAALTSTEGGDLGYAARAAVGIPLIADSLAVRLVATRTSDQGYIANLADGDPHSNGYRTTTARAIVLWQPDDAFSARLLVDYQYAHQNALGYISDPTTASLAAFSTAGNYVNDAARIISADLHYKLGPLSLESISSYYARYRDRNVFEPVYTGEFGLIGEAIKAPSIYQVNTLDQTRYSQVSQEFRVLSDPTKVLSFVAGAFYRTFDLTENIDYQSQDFVAFAPLYAGVLRVPAPAAPSSFASELSNELGIDSLYSSPATDMLANNGRQLSGFIEGTVRIRNNLRLIAGVRRHHESIEATSLGGGLDYFATLAPPRNFLASTSADAWLPKFSLEFNPTKDILLYATYTEGVRDGNLNAAGKVALIAQENPTHANEIETFGPEFEKSAEFGVKGSALDHRILWEVSPYYNWIKSLQGYGTASFKGATVGVIENIGDGHSAGIEGDVRARVAPGLTVFLGGTRIHSVVDSIFPNLVSPVKTKPGQRLPFVPNYTVSGGAEFEHALPISNWTGFVNGTASYTGDYTTYIEAPDGSAQNPTLGNYAIVNFKLGVRGDRWSVDLGIANAFDRRVVVSLSPVQALFTSYGLKVPPGGNLDDWQMWRPRTLTLTVRTTF
ncbi:MAG: TonB-dependent receptor [Acetobacteraceae bacterium]